MLFLTEFACSAPPYVLEPLCTALICPSRYSTCVCVRTCTCAPVWLLWIVANDSIDCTFVPLSFLDRRLYRSMCSLFPETLHPVLHYVNRHYPITFKEFFTALAEAHQELTRIGKKISDLTYVVTHAQSKWKCVSVIVTNLLVTVCGPARQVSCDQCIYGVCRRVVWLDCITESSVWKSLAIRLMENLGNA